MKIKTFFKAILFLLYIVMLTIYGLLFTLQRHLLFTGQDDHRVLGTPESYHMTGFEEVHLTTPDGLRLLAWSHAPAPGMPVILYLHGNGGNLSNRAERFQAFANAGYGVFGLSWRGYSNTEGRPSEEGFYTDARAALKYLTDAPHASPVLLYGESLGTGVAVEMAYERPHVMGLVLDSAYTSIPDRVSAMYWFFPGIRYFVRDEFDSLSKIGSVTCPVLLLHGEQDRVVPVESARMLAAATHARNKLLIAPGFGHVHVPDEVIIHAMNDFFLKRK